MLKVPCPAGYQCDYGTTPNGQRVVDLQMPPLPPPVSPRVPWLLSAPGKDISVTIIKNHTWKPCDPSKYCDQSTEVGNLQDCIEGNYCPTGTAMYCC